MGNKRKGQLTTDSEWHKHLRKIGKRFFWKSERIAEKKMIEQDLKELKIQSLTEPEINSIEKLYNYLSLNLNASVDYEDLLNLYYSLFCALDILPENLRSLILTKEVLAVIFAKLSTEKNITHISNKNDSGLVSFENIKDENHWIEQISALIEAKLTPNHEKARVLIGRS